MSWCFRLTCHKIVTKVTFLWPFFCSMKVNIVLKLLWPCAKFKSHEILSTVYPQHWFKHCDKLGSHVILPTVKPKLPFWPCDKFKWHEILECNIISTVHVHSQAMCTQLVTTVLSLAWFLSLKLLEYK